jgi:hypothetical protein
MLQAALPGMEEPMAKDGAGEMEPVPIDLKKPAAAAPAAEGCAC